MHPGAMIKVVAILGMGKIQPLIGILIMGIETPTIGLSLPIPYYMEMSWELIDPIAHIHLSIT